MSGVCVGVGVSPARVPQARQLHRPRRSNRRGGVDSRRGRRREAGRGRRWRGAAASDGRHGDVGVGAGDVEVGGAAGVGRTWIRGRRHEAVTTGRRGGHDGHYGHGGHGGHGCEVQRAVVRVRGHARGRLVKAGSVGLFGGNIYLWDGRGDDD